MENDLLRRIPRGGSTVVDPESEEEEEEMEGDLDEEDDEEDEDEEGDEDKSRSVASGEPVSITCKTNTGNPLIDVSLELLVARSRKIESVKTTLSRMLPGRPPVESFSIRYDGMLLEDDSLVDELFDEDEEDDDEESSGKVLTLDMIPPVDPKFATQMGKMQEMSTSQLLDAYATNSAAMYQNGAELYSNPLNTQKLADDEDVEEEESSQHAFSVQTPASIRLQEQAQEVRERLVSNFPEKTLELLDQEGPPPDPSEMVEQRRGQRYRASRGGVKTSLKRTVQTNLNINWSVTVRNFMLFLFFGIFGGRSTVSRNLLILGAPLCFLLQARPMKLTIKQLFYFCSQPPGILLSLLPAPQQAILNFVQDVELQAVYGIETKDDEFDEEENTVLESLVDVDDEEETDDSTDVELDDEEEMEESDESDSDED